MTCKTCNGFGYLLTAPSTCSAGGERRSCPVCAPDAAASEAGEAGEDMDSFRDLERAPLAALHRLQHTGSPAAKPKLGGSILQWAADEIAALRAAVGAGQ